MCVVRVYWCACHVLVFVSECVFVKICWYLCMYGTDYVDVWKWSSCMLSVRPTGVSWEGGCMLARLPLAPATRRSVQLPSTDCTGYATRTMLFTVCTVRMCVCVCRRYRAIVAEQEAARRLQEEEDHYRYDHGYTLNRPCTCRCCAAADASCHCVHTRPLLMCLCGAWQPHACTPRCTPPVLEDADPRLRATAPLHVSCLCILYPHASLFPCWCVYVRCMLRWLLVEEEVELRRKQAEQERLARAERTKQEMMRANEEQKRIRERLAREGASYNESCGLCVNVCAGTRSCVLLIEHVVLFCEHEL